MREVHLLGWEDGSELSRGNSMWEGPQAGVKVHSFTEELKESQSQCSRKSEKGKHGQAGGVEPYFICVRIYMTTLILCPLVKKEKKNF